MQHTNNPDLAGQHDDDNHTDDLVVIAARFSGALWHACGAIVAPELISELLSRFHLVQYEELEARLCFLERVIAVNSELFRMPQEEKTTCLTN